MTKTLKRHEHATASGKIKFYSLEQTKSRRMKYAIHVLSPHCKNRIPSNSHRNNPKSQRVAISYLDPLDS